MKSQVFEDYYGLWLIVWWFIGLPKFCSITLMLIANRIYTREDLQSYVFTMNDGNTNWRYSLVKCVAQSTTLVEYVAVTKMTKKVNWLDILIKEMEWNKKWSIFIVIVWLQIKLWTLEWSPSTLDINLSHKQFKIRWLSKSR